MFQTLWEKGHPISSDQYPTLVSLTCRHQQDESKEKPHCGGGSWAWRSGGGEDDKNWGEAGSVCPCHHPCRQKCIPVYDTLSSVYPRFTSNSWSSGLSLLTAEMAGAGHYARLRNLPLLPCLPFPAASTHAPSWFLSLEGPLFLSALADPSIVL